MSSAMPPAKDIVAKAIQKNPKADLTYSHR